jgi:hypothetical protein
MLEPVFTVVQEVVMSPYQTNMVSLNVLPEDNSTLLFSGLDVLLISTDDSEFFVPEFGVDQIGFIDVTDGFNCFLNGANPQTAMVEGLPVDYTETSIGLNPFMINIMPYLPQECMSTSDIFAGYEDDILIVKSDASEYYVPAFGVATLSEMCPGEGYGIFLNGSEGIDFMYPSGVAAATTDAFINDYKESAHRDDVALTGESHLVLFESISGEVQEGDILRAYANDKLVGSINILEAHLNGSTPIDLVAHGTVDLSEFDGPVLDWGYDQGDKIEIALYSKSKGYELKVNYNFDLGSLVYGEGAQLSVGSANVTTESYEVTDFKLTQNYPNPFNPTTTIQYNVANEGLVSLKVYDITGRLVKTLVDNQFRNPGNEAGYSVVWNGLDDRGQKVSAGLYIYRLQSGAMSMTNKMILLK